MIESLWEHSESTNHPLVINIKCYSSRSSGNSRSIQNPDGRDLCWDSYQPKCPPLQDTATHENTPYTHCLGWINGWYICWRCLSAEMSVITRTENTLSHCHWNKDRWPQHYQISSQKPLLGIKNLNTTVLNCLIGLDRSRYIVSVFSAFLKFLNSTIGQHK